MGYAACVKGFTLEIKKSIDIIYIFSGKDNILEEFDLEFISIFVKVCGLTFKEFVAKCFILRETIHQDRRLGHIRQLSDFESGRIVDLHETGLSVREIAKQQTQLYVPFG